MASHGDVMTHAINQSLYHKTSFLVQKKSEETKNIYFFK